MKARPVPTRKQIERVAEQCSHESGHSVKTGAMADRSAVQLHGGHCCDPLDEHGRGLFVLRGGLQATQ